jgi:thiol reductant ABC exporter CydC subunit
MTRASWWRPIVQPHARALAGATSLHALTGASGVALLATSAWLIATAAGHPSVAVLGVAVVGVRFFGLARGLARYAERLTTHGAILALLGRAQVAVFRALLPLGPAWLHGRGRGDVLMTLVADVETFDNLFARTVIPVASSVAVAGFTLAVLGWRAWALAGIAAAGLCVAGVVLPLLTEHAGRRSAARLVDGRTRLADNVADLVLGLSDVLVFDTSGVVPDKLRRSTAVLERDQRLVAAVSAAGLAASTFVTDVTTVAVVAAGATLAARGVMDHVQVAVVALTTLAAFEVVQSLAQSFAGLGGQRVSLARIGEVFDSEAAVGDPADPAPLPAATRLTVRDLSFSYPDQAEPALSALSFELGPGRVVALVGESGCGKSTAIRLLCRQWDVAPGSLSVDGVDLRDLRRNEARKLFSVSQQPVDILTGSLRENLLLAKQAASDDELLSTLDRVGLGAMVRRLPERLDTWLGDLGTALSGGQRQQLALARALLRPAPFLLLDEPTAHMDTDAAAALLSVVRREAATRGVLLTSNKPAELGMADEVIVLGQGRVIGRGGPAGGLSPTGRDVNL